MDASKVVTPPPFVPSALQTVGYEQRADHAGQVASSFCIVAGSSFTAFKAKVRRNRRKCVRVCSGRLCIDA